MDVGKIVFRPLFPAQALIRGCVSFKRVVFVCHPLAAVQAIKALHPF